MPRRPALLAALLAALGALALAGCPGRAPAAAGLAPGLRLRYALRSGAGAREVHEVVAVTTTEVVARVTVEGAAGEPLERRFPVAPPPADLEGGEAGPPLRLGPLTLDPWVTTAGATRTTTAVRGRTPVFPGVVRVERGGEVLLELVDVE